MKDEELKEKDLSKVSGGVLKYPIEHGIPGSEIVLEGSKTELVVDDLIKAEKL